MFGGTIEYHSGLFKVFPGIPPIDLAGVFQPRVCKQQAAPFTPDDPQLAPFFVNALKRIAAAEGAIYGDNILARVMFFLQPASFVFNGPLHIQSFVISRSPAKMYLCQEC